MSIKRWLLLAAFICAVGIAGWGYWFVVNHSFSARSQPTWYEAALARHARRLATELGARNMTNPLPPSLINVAEGRDHFADHCAICHANDGSGKTMMGSSMYPPAPDMRDKGSQELSDGELMYIIKNGIRFTGMPGWGGESEENWKLVLFIRHLPKLSSEERKLMNDVNQLDGLSANESRPGNEKMQKMH